jgi:DNA-directed RNA polymerase subunit beta'
MHSDKQHLVSVNDFGAVRISLASPEDVLRWSCGEVTRPDTINYRTHRPEKGGLFCERIFGPEKDWECSCGKYRGVKHKGFTCDRCGVQVSHSRVRRKRMGHIELAAPVVHIWFFKSKPSALALLLDMKAAELESVVYHRSRVVVASQVKGLKRGGVLSDEQYQIARAGHPEAFTALSGAEAIENLLAGLDMARLAGELRGELAKLSRRDRPPLERRKKLVRRLELIEALLRSPIRPEWMVLRRIPVIPPDLRPVVMLESGTYASSDLNDLYRRVIQRNIRLKKLMDLNAPEIIQRNEKRLLQQAVDALFDNTACSAPVQGSARRELKSLADMLKGKQGRFRENLLGKRVDYSGRSVIVVGPELKLHQCGLPKVMALELFQPFLIRRLRELEGNLTVQKARRMIKERREVVFDALETVMRGHPVLLNRAPTLHRMGIQAFEPVLVEGNAIRLHPLVCKAFNADFDGDQMAVHLLLSVEAIREARELMMAAKNIFSPANGQPIITPSKDMVLGCYYLTARAPHQQGAPKAFASAAEVIRAHAEGLLGVHDLIQVRLAAGREVVTESGVKATGSRTSTTAGRVLFNDTLGSIATPGGEHRAGTMPFYDLPLTGRNLSRIIADCREKLGSDATVELLERIKAVGFREATRSGLSFAASDLVTPGDKEAILAEAQRQADQVKRRFEDGLMTAEERYEKVTELWEQTTRRVAERLMEELAGDRRAGQALNPLHVMVSSGARGSQSQLGQLAGMRGAMRRPSGEVLETPIKASFREGLSSLEYFTSTHGARKGLVDMAMKTSDAGHLTRKLADVAQHVVVTVEDCGTKDGFRRVATRERPLGQMVVGRTSCRAVRRPLTGKMIVREGDLISAKQARGLEEEGVEELEVRSPMTCRAARGVCRCCYGMDRSTGRRVELGVAVGVIAAQSIGEPATQLTMRTFHHGGAASAEDITLSLPRVIELFDAHRSKRSAVLAEVTGKVRVGGPGERIRKKRVVFIQPTDARGRASGKEVAHVIPDGRRLTRRTGELVQVGEPLTAGPVGPHDLLRVLGPDAVRLYLLEEVQKVYRTYGVDIDDKHVEVVIARMLGKVKVLDGGDTELLPGQVVERGVLLAANAGLADGRRKAKCSALLLGVEKAAVQADSFLAAASFQETTKVLAQAALAGKVDELHGLKENVLLGRVVPAGTGFRPAVEPQGQA